jgi:hypothetical protein
LLHRAAKAALVDVRTSGGIEILAEEFDAARKRARRATDELRLVEADETKRAGKFPALLARPVYGGRRMSRCLLRLSELIELATDPEIVDRMITELGPEMTIAVLLFLKNKAESYHPDEIETAGGS